MTARFSKGNTSTLEEKRAVIDPPSTLFIAAIIVVGVIRFALSVSGVPDATVKYVSMSVVITAGMLYFAVTCKTWKERMKAAYLLILPYMLVEGAALGYTVATGKMTIFHAREYSFGTSPLVHFIGHLVGGVSWEPLSLFVVMQVIGYVSSRALSFRRN